MEIDCLINPQTNYISKVLDLPNEILYKILSLLDNKDIDNLYAVGPIKQRIETLFAVASDIVPSHYFPNISTTHYINTQLIESLNHYISPSLLWLLVEIHDLKHTLQYLPHISGHVANRVSILDEALPFAWGGSNDDNSSKWLERFSFKTKHVSFDNLIRLTLTDVSIDPKLFSFPKVEILRLTRVQSSDLHSKFDLPSLRSLYVSGLFHSVNSSIDYENCSPGFKTLTMTGVSDMMRWDHINNSTLELVSVYECGSLIIFNDLELRALERWIIKDTDVHSITNINAPHLISLHVEQFITAYISIHDVYFPKLKHLLLWIFQISNIYNVFAPVLKVASIMLSGEPIPSETHKVDLSCFKTVTSIQICCAAEILKHIDTLETLEVRGPFTNPLLFSLEFNHLTSFHVYFNNRLTEIPKIKAKNLYSLHISRCSTLSTVQSLERDYPTIKALSIEYSELRDFSNLTLPELERISYVTSTSQPLFVKQCFFPRLISFEALNLEITSIESSIFEFEAPMLESMRITNFSIDQLNIHEFHKLKQVTAIGGVKNLDIKNCSNLRDLDISRNELQMIHTDCLDKLLALECEDTNIVQSHIDAPLLTRLNDGITGATRFVIKRTSVSS